MRRRGFLGTVMLGMVHQPGELAGRTDPANLGARTGWHNIRDYGAQCDGKADDTRAWRTALRQAATAGGVVCHPGGVSLVRSGLTVPPDVSIVGTAKAVLKAGNPGPACVLTVGGDTFGAGSLGNRHGIVQDLQLDGSGIAEIGLRVGGSVQRRFGNVDIRSCAAHGLVVDAAQNCFFESVNVEHCGAPSGLASGLLLDRGAGNNAFVRCEINGNAPYAILLRQSGPAPEGAFLEGPSANLFVGCVIERAATGTRGCIYQRAGRNNVFLSCDIGITAPDCFAVKVDQGDATGPTTSMFLRFESCRFIGDPSSGTAFDLSGAYRTVVSNCFFESFARGFQVDDASDVQVGGHLHMGGVAKPVAPTGLRPPNDLVTQAGAPFPLTLVTPDGPRLIHWHSGGSPNGELAANPGSLVLDVRSSVWYQKTGDSGLYGWKPIALLEPDGSFRTTGGAVLGSQLPADATTGFTYLPTCLGKPTGKPVRQPGSVPVVFDVRGKRLWVYADDQWIAVGR